MRIIVLLCILLYSSFTCSEGYPISSELKNFERYLSYVEQVNNNGAYWENYDLFYLKRISKGAFNTREIYEQIEKLAQFSQGVTSIKVLFHRNINENFTHTIFRTFKLNGDKLNISVTFKNNLIVSITKATDEYLLDAYLSRAPTK